MGSLEVKAVEINGYSTGTRIQVADRQRLIEAIAIILMGQAAHATEIINQLGDLKPGIDNIALRREAIASVRTPEAEGNRYHRDGLLHEIISWIATIETFGSEIMIRDPHLKATRQGLDGLMIKIDSESQTVTKVMIFEDKCSSEPRKKFRDEILPFFTEIHAGARSADLLASAAALVKESQIERSKITAVAAEVLENGRRVYRGGLAVQDAEDNQAARQSIFKGFEKLQDISAEQRHGAVLVTTGGLRSWFDALAEDIVNHIERMPPDVR